MNRGIINDKEVNLKKAKEILDKTNGVLLDVRSHQEYNEEHLPGAININLYDLKKKLTGKPCTGKSYARFDVAGIGSTDKAVRLFSTLQLQLQRHFEKKMKRGEKWEEHIIQDQ